MTKKSLVQEIRDKLTILKVSKYGCSNINTITNMNWVGYGQVSLSEHIGGALYRNYRLPLYSKGVSLETLIAINNELGSKIKEWENLNL